MCMYVSVWDFVCERELALEENGVQRDAFVIKCMSEMINMLVNGNHPSMNLIKKSPCNCSRIASSRSMKDFP